MRKLIAAINMTVDGFCDHTAGIPDEAIHKHYTGLLNDAGVILYGRKTFQLMEYWKSVLKDPTAEPSMEEFAIAIDKIPKIVFSRTLQNTGWKSARLADQDPAEEVSALRRQPGKDILVGSPGLIVALTKLNLIDEYQLCIHPVVTGSGLPLFRDITETINLQLVKTKPFAGGAIILYYQPKRV
ncbi:dihydrofolate reductase family protein [Ferruginibacter sp. HRS2-29]|uniref:dihydrofolate reductase family protein n=1 Tax=Ferruginibacter sp. HRS2-29 TaxID=2487334 RepID=UPI0020CD6CD4|nr:dihydrofolate reductase family protein [Ferruginibacter sp. HRS2-29]MCP9749675.1 dihydrofolate reductase [Ferruginibacter sp. HRS2-29]